MSLRKLSEEISVCGQIGPDDLQIVAEQGFKTVINNRPDGESADQPAHALFEARAKELGLALYYLPLAMGQAPSMALLQEFRQVFDTAEKPVFAFCRSGNRSAQIFSGAALLPL